MLLYICCCSRINAAAFFRCVCCTYILLFAMLLLLFRINADAYLFNFFCCTVQVSMPLLILLLLRINAAAYFFLFSLHINAAVRTYMLLFTYQCHCLLCWCFWTAVLQQSLWIVKSRSYVWYLLCYVCWKSRSLYVASLRATFDLSQIETNIRS